MSSSDGPDITLEPCAFFGISGTLRNNIHSLGEDECCYLGGQYIVTNNIRKNKQSFIKLKSSAHIIEEGALGNEEKKVDGATVTTTYSDKANDNAVKRRRNKHSFFFRFFFSFGFFFSSCFFLFF